MNRVGILRLKKEFDCVCNAHPGFAAFNVVHPHEAVGIAAGMANRAVAMFLDEHFSQMNALMIAKHFRFLHFLAPLKHGD